VQYDGDRLHKTRLMSYYRQSFLEIFFGSVCLQKCEKNKQESAYFKVMSEDQVGSS